MRFLSRVTVLALLLALAAGVQAAPPPQETPDLFILVNQARRAAGLVPLRASQELNAAAQRHSADMSATGQLQHVGSDNSRPEDRIADAGYAAYGDTGLYVSENITRSLSAEGALAWWLDDPSSQGNLLSPNFREIGAGTATGADGQIYFTLTFGARPNSLPIFVNDDDPETGSAVVLLTLTNETVQPAGEGTAVIGLATEVRISNAPGFPDAAWRAWAPSLAWTLSPGGGLKTVYIQFRDVQGRTTGATDSITLSASAPTNTPSQASPGAPTPGATGQPSTANPPPGAGVPAPPVVLSASPSGSPAAPRTPTSTAPGTAGPDARTAESGVPPQVLAAVCVLHLIGVLLTGYVVLRRGVDV